MRSITAISAFVSLGFSIAALRAAGPTDRNNAMYTCARSIALAVTAVVALFARSTPFLAAVAIAMVILQAIDAIIGGILHDRLKTLGPALTALANAAALVWLLQQ